MYEFLRGWKRKVGVVTLVLACVFAAGWVRSDTYSDTITRPLSNGTYTEIRSENGYLLSTRTVLHDASDLPSFSWRTLLSCDPNGVYLYYRDHSIGWRAIGFAIGGQLLQDEGKSNRRVGKRSLFKERRTWFASYQTVVLPLTLLSAWHLLSKPRRKETKPPSES